MCAHGLVETFREKIDLYPSTCAIHVSGSAPLLRSNPEEAGGFKCQSIMGQPSPT